MDTVHCDNSNILYVNIICWHVAKNFDGRGCGPTLEQTSCYYISGGGTGRGLKLRTKIDFTNHKHKRKNSVMEDVVVFCELLNSILNKSWSVTRVC